MYTWTHQSFVSCQLVDGPKLHTKSSLMFNTYTADWRASIDGQIQDKDHAVSQLAEDPHGAHLQGEDPD